MYTYNMYKLLITISYKLNNIITTWCINVYMQDLKPGDPFLPQLLKIASYIGACLSILCLLLVLIIYLSSRSVTFAIALIILKFFTMFYCDNSGLIYILAL